MIYTGRKEFLDLFKRFKEQFFKVLETANSDAKSMLIDAIRIYQDIERADSSEVGIVDKVSTLNAIEQQLNSASNTNIIEFYKLFKELRQLFADKVSMNYKNKFAKSMKFTMYSKLTQLKDVNNVKKLYARLVRDNAPGITDTGITEEEFIALGYNEHVKYATQIHLRQDVSVIPNKE